MNIGIVLVSYNSAACIAKCLTSVISESEDLNAFIIMIDNDSQDETRAIVRQRFPQVRVIHNSANLGFSKAANQGIKHCLRMRCESILLLNPDTLMEDGSLSAMRDTLRQNSKCAVVQPLITLMSNPQTINTWGNEYRGFGIVSLGGHGREVRSAEFGVDREIHYASGACMLIRASILKKIGFLDERFFLYFEDTEFSDRVRKAGYQIRLSGGSRVRHDYRYPLSFQKLKYFLKSWHHYCFHRFS